MNYFFTSDELTLLYKDSVRRKINKINLNVTFLKLFPFIRKKLKCAQIGRCAKQFKVLPHTAVCETICLTD